MSPLVCPHIENPTEQHLRSEAERRRIEEVRAKVREGRWSELTPVDRGVIDAVLYAAAPSA